MTSVWKKIPAVTSICLAMGLRSTLAVTGDELDDFQDGSNGGWGGNTTGQIENITTGGPAGAGDRFLRVDVVGFHLGTKNTNQWAGDYLTAGIKAVEVTLNHLAPGDDDVEMRVLLFGPGGTFASQNLTPTITANEWTQYTFGLTSRELVHVTGGSGILADTLAEVSTLLLRNDTLIPTPPRTHPPHITATIGIDNIRALLTIWYDGAVLGDGWRHLGWFGFCNDANYPWIYHDSHGWMYSVGESTESVWMYTFDMGWLWTGQDQYPYLYRSSDDAWLWHLPDSNSPRWFFNLNTSQWEER
jgi:hypothetical protein